MSESHNKYLIQYFICMRIEVSSQYEQKKRENIFGTEFDYETM